jgi:hypothetical protein
MKLELRHEPSGWRHYLGELPVHCGDVILFQVWYRTWIPVRYEWSCRLEDSPTFHSDSCRIIPFPHAQFCWRND